ncbi:MAG: 6-phosphogluconolactonase [Polyangiales bacterium]
MKTIVAEVPDVFAARGAELVVEAAAESIAARGRFVLVLAGGSTPGSLHRMLASEAYRSRIAWARAHIFFGDERAVPGDAKESNYGAAHADLLQHLPIPPENVHRMQGESKDLAAAARDYEATLLDVSGCPEGATPAPTVAPADELIDLMFVGIGKDAHIFSLFPFAPAIDEKHALVVAEINPPMNPALSRITMTPKAILRARCVVAIATGGDKREAVHLARSGPYNPRQYPAQLLRRAHDLVWLLDTTAAGAP